MTPEERAKSSLEWVWGVSPVIYDAVFSSCRLAIHAAEMEEREACARVAETKYPQGGAHTYASENADRYIAFEEASAEIAAAIRARE